MYIYIYMQFSVEKRKDLNSNFTIRPLEKKTQLFTKSVWVELCVYS